MTQKAALNVLCEGSPENYNKYGNGSESFNNFSGTYKKYTKYINYVPWPTPCEVAVEISRMANCGVLPPNKPGLGVTMNLDLLSDPVASWEE